MTPMRRPGIKQNLLVSFSGGRTSAYMCALLLERFTHRYNMVFVFANTGLEHEDTLRFIDAVDRHLGLNLIWIEAALKEMGVGTSYKIVDYTTAARNGEPMEAVIAKYGLPNLENKHCTRSGKIEPINACGADYFQGRVYRTAIGIRADEPKRVSETGRANGVIYPLVDTWPTTKEDVVAYWEDFDFDLRIPEFEGNCRACFHKSDRKLLAGWQRNPGLLDFFARMEKKYQTTGADPTRRIFRGYRNTGDMLNLFSIIGQGSDVSRRISDEDSGGCSEACEAY